MALNGVVELNIPQGGGGTQVQPDWNQNNSTAVDYVKNRTHYVETEATTLDEETITLIPSYTGSVDLTGEIQNGVQYTITIGSSSFVGAGITGMLGNLILYENGNTFISIGSKGRCEVRGIEINPLTISMSVVDSSQNVLFDDTVEFYFDGSQVSLSGEFQLEDEVQYKVFFGEDEYTAVAEYGELNVNDVFYLYGTELTVSKAEYMNQTLVFKIVFEEEAVHQLDDKYISDNIARTADIPAQVQANWTQPDSSAADYIKNKPVDSNNNVRLGVQGYPISGGYENIVMGSDSSSITNGTKCVAIGGAISVSTTNVQGAVRMGGYGGEGQATLNSSGSFAIGGSGMATVGQGASSTNSAGSGFIGHCGNNSSIKNSQHSVVVGGEDTINITAGSSQCSINSFGTISSTVKYNTLVSSGGNAGAAISGSSLYTSIIAASDGTISNSGFSAIVGGTGNTMTGCYNSVILGGSGISATESNTVYMQNANMSEIITLGTLKLKDDSGILKVSDDGGSTWKTVSLT